jgi:toxin-antitoxin system PIN domain toxin
LPSSGDFLDVNVWLALLVEAHSHHGPARAYWDTQAVGPAVLCRVTHLALLRHLTNRTIMGANALSPEAAWRKGRELLGLPDVRFRDEPAGLAERWARFSNTGRTSPNMWTDASQAAGLRLVTSDRAFGRFRGLDVLAIPPEREEATPGS